MSNQQLARRDVIGNTLQTIRHQVNSLMLKDKQKADRFLAASLVVATDTNLNACDPNSIAQSLLGIAMLDLNVDKNVGHAYLVPYGGKAQLQLGYKGFIQLMYRSGWMCKAFPVYQCDAFDMSFDGWDNKVKFVPNLDERDEGDKQWVIDNLRGIYVVARHADSKDEYSTFINKAVIEKLRLVSSNQQKVSDKASEQDKKWCAEKKPFGIWRDWYAEMATAKAVKKLAKQLPIGDRRLEAVIAADDRVDTGKPVDMVRTIEAEYVIEGESEVIEDKPEPTALPELTAEQFKAKQAAWFKQVESGKPPADLIAVLETKNTLTEEQKLTIHSWGAIND